MNPDSKDIKNEIKELDQNKLMNAFTKSIEEQHDKKYTPADYYLIAKRTVRKYTTSQETNDLISILVGVIEEVKPSKTNKPPG